MPFLGKTPAQIVDPEVDIDGGSIDGATIGATSASAATVTTFTSTGIDDNATSTAITIDSSQNVGINTISASGPQSTFHIEQNGDDADGGFRLSRDNALASYTQYLDPSSNWNLAYGNPASDDAPTDYLTVTNGGNVGINTAQPVSLLDVLHTVPKITANSNSFATAGNGTGFGIYRSAFGRQAGYTWTIENAVKSGGSTTADYQTDSLVFKARVNVTDSSLTDRVVLGPNGNVQITDGNLVVANGHGIDFSATGQASGMTSELLDDYEEGTWTPVLGSTSTATSATYSQQVGYYTKVGNRVFFNMFLVFNITASGSGNFYVTLPFNVQTGLTYAAQSISYQNIFSEPAGYHLGCYAEQNSNLIYFTFNNSVQPPPAVASGRTLMVSGHYQV